MKNKDRKFPKEILITGQGAGGDAYWQADEKPEDTVEGSEKKKVGVYKFSHFVEVQKIVKVSALLLFALFALFSGHASAQSWSLPNPYPTNNITWLPQPQTNRPVMTIGIVPHSITIQNFTVALTNGLSSTANVTNNFFISLDGTNKIPYLIATVNGNSWTGGNAYTPSGTNATDTIVFASTNILLYGAAQTVVGTNSQIAPNQAAQSITTLY